MSTGVAIADAIDAELRTLGNPERADAEKRYLKSDLLHIGTSVPAIRRVTRTVLASYEPIGRGERLAAAEALWARRVHECRMAAVELLELSVNLLEGGDLALVEALIRDARTWALVDGLAASVAGAMVERMPHLAHRLDAWAADDDSWLRRSALLVELEPLRRGAGDFERFSHHADALLDDREFFVRKAIGWVLRDTARQRPELVYSWLLPRAARASAITVREAVKPLSEAQRESIARMRASR